MDDQRPKVGVALLLIKGNKILLGKRKGTWGVGEYGTVGGHLEHLESIKGALLRELAEEAGTDLQIQNLRFLCVTNLTKYAPRHYIDIGLVAHWKSGEPRVTEPDKRENWGWYDIDNLPHPLFGVMEEYIEAYKTGKTFFDA